MNMHQITLNSRSVKQNTAWLQKKNHNQCQYQARSQKSAMGGCYKNLGAERQPSEAIVGLVASAQKFCIFFQN